MIAAEVAAALGDAHRAGAWWRCHCPVHGSQGSTLALRDGDRALIVKCWAGCDARDVLAELRRLGLIAGGSDDAQPAVVAIGSDDTARRIAAAGRIWADARDARGTPVGCYLHGRAMTIPPPASLRWAPRCWHREARADLPAMVALVEHIERGVVGVHRTWLARDDGGVWRRRDRASLGPIAGGAVRLAPAAETLLIGEGLETCLGAMQATAMPAWAALSTSGMIALILPPIVRTVVILADNDRSGAGERAAYAAADRWLGEGRRVKIAMPPEPGSDFADVLLGHVHVRIKEVADVAA